MEFDAIERVTIGAKEIEIRLSDAVARSVAEDQPSGGVSAFTVGQASGDLKLINKVDSHGKWPCHLSVHPSGKFVLVANYGTGVVILRDFCRPLTQTRSVCLDGVVCPIERVILRGSRPHAA